LQIDLECRRALFIFILKFEPHLNTNQVKNKLKNSKPEITDVILMGLTMTSAKLNNMKPAHL